VLFSFEDGDNIVALSSRILGFSWRQFVGLPYASSVSLVAVDFRTGGSLWRSQLTGVRQPSAGHIAGTPVVVDSLVVVPFPVIGEVAALSVVDGSVKWRQRVYPARGSVSVVNGQAFAATNLKTSVVVDLRSGRQVCSQVLPGRVDRAGLTISGNTGILTFLDGRISAAPVSEWMTCTVVFTPRDSSRDRVKE
jgi:outer membrane protein assembly factor BamB